MRGTLYDSGLSETRPKWFKKVRKFDSRCYCWETNGLTLEVVVWGPRIYEIETNYKTLKVIGHCSDFEIKTLYIFKFEWNNLIEILMGNNVSYRD